MSGQNEVSNWTYHHIGLLVTGKGEEKFLPSLLRSLMGSGQCHIEVIRRIPQLSPITSPRRIHNLVKTNKSVKDSNALTIGALAKTFLKKGGSRFVILVDDLEYRRRDIHNGVLDRYRKALDTMLVPMGGDFSARAAVHFLINMVEAYYFADPQAVNEVMGGELADHTGDVEDIRHPKNELKNQFPGFDEVVHGEKIAKRLNLDLVLSNTQTCASLRTLIKWCVMSMRQPLTERFQLLHGVTHPVTNGQLAVWNSPQ